MVLVSSFVRKPARELIQPPPSIRVLTARAATPPCTGWAQAWAHGSQSVYRREDGIHGEGFIAMPLQRISTSCRGKEEGTPDSAK